jgi:hypothetical protein
MNFCRFSRAIGAGLFALLLLGVPMRRQAPVLGSGLHFIGSQWQFFFDDDIVGSMERTGMTLSIVTPPMAITGRRTRETS